MSEPKRFGSDPFEWVILSIILAVVGLVAVNLESRVLEIFGWAFLVASVLVGCYAHEAWARVVAALSKAIRYLLLVVLAVAVSLAVVYGLVKLVKWFWYM